MQTEWKKSVSTETSLQNLVSYGVLPEKEIAGWRAPLKAEIVPMPGTDEAVVFESYFTRGFGMPAHPFLQKLLRFYNISLCNLPPNSIQHISVFIYLCECWLRIEPHFALFQYFFCLRRRGSRGSKIAGGAYLCLRDGKASEYIECPFQSNPGTWFRNWFYIRQPEVPFLDTDPTRVPIPNDNWYLPPSHDYNWQIEDLVKLIKASRVQGPEVTRIMFIRRCQPCKKRDHPGFQYADENDSTRERPEMMSAQMILIIYKDQYGISENMKRMKGYKDHSGG